MSDSLTKAPILASSFALALSTVIMVVVKKKEEEI